MVTTLSSPITSEPHYPLHCISFVLQAYSEDTSERKVAYEVSNPPSSAMTWILLPSRSATVLDSSFQPLNPPINSIKIIKQSKQVSIHLFIENKSMRRKMGEYLFKLNINFILNENKSENINSIEINYDFNHKSHLLANKVYNVLKNNTFNSRIETILKCLIPAAPRSSSCIIL